MLRAIVVWRQTLIYKKTVNLRGSGCKRGLECVSFECDWSTEMCAQAPAVIAQDQCLGAAAAI